jgi:hypothetical protein
MTAYDPVTEEMMEIIKTLSNMTDVEKRNYYNQLIAMDIIPFDISCSLSQDPTAFGFMGSGERISKIAQFTGKPLKDGKRTVLPTGIIGEVVGDEHGRIVIKTELGYLGWVNPEEYRILEISKSLKNLDTLH